MRKVGRKLLSFLLVLAILATSTEVSVFAAENEQELNQDEVAVEEITDTDYYDSEITNTEDGWDGETLESVYEAEGFKVTFTLTGYWEGAYNANVRIDNLSDTSIESWKTEITYEGNISNVWNAEIVSNDNGKYIIKNAGWNQDILAGGYVEFGLSGQESFKGFPTAYKMLGTKEITNEEEYTINYNIDSDSGTDYIGSVTITNNTDKIIEDWVLDFDCESTIESIWDGVIESHEENHYIVKNAGYNQNIRAHESISFGFIMSNGNVSIELTNFVLSKYTEKEEIVEREKEPLESIGEAYYKEPTEADIVTDKETGLRYVRNQLLVSAYMGADKYIFEEIAAEVGAEIVGYIELTNDYQFEFIEEKTLDEIQIIADYIDSFSFVSSVTLNLIDDVIMELTTTNDALYNDGATSQMNSDSQMSLNTRKPDTWNETTPDGDNWGLEALNVLSAWDYKSDFSTVKVGVYDRGFDENEDLIFDEIVNNPAGVDPKHGNHVVGILAAQHNNGKGISGVATDTRLYAYAYSGKDFGSLMGDKLAYATLIGNHVKVINVSVGMEVPIQYAASHNDTKAQAAIQASADILEEYLNKLVTQGYDFVIVTSAGNSENVKLVQDNNEPYGYRIYDSANEEDTGKKTYSGGVYAQYDCALTAITDKNLKERIIVVGAIGHSTLGSTTQYSYSAFSNIGDRVDVCAPGEDILSTVSTSVDPSGYILDRGTSMASPYIAGIVAMMYQANPALKASKIKHYLKLSSTQSVTDSYNYTYKIPNALTCYRFAIHGSSDDGNDLTLPSGILCGYTKDIDNHSVANVKLTAIRKSTGEYNLGEHCFTFESDSNGYYMQTLPQGTYDIVIYAEGYLPYSVQNVIIEPDQTNYMENLILSKWISTGYTHCAVKGKVIDALNGNTISDATIKIRKGWNTTSGAYVSSLFGTVRSTTTATDGTFLLSANLGAYTVEITKGGYVTGYYNIVSGDTGSLSDLTMTTMVLTPVLSDDEYRIVLTWGESPRDLDSHLTYYVDDTQKFHVFFSQKSASIDGEVVAKLDLDDTSSYGPETVTITLDSSLVQDGGLFKYSVHNYTGRSSLNSTDLSLSNATVRVYAGNNLEKTFNVPKGEVGTVWHVFDIDEGGIKPINEFYNVTVASEVK